MIYLKKIEIVSQTYPGSHVLEKNFPIICSDINIIVGDQGCGKSTLLKLLQQNHSDLKIELSDIVSKNGIESFYFDSEKDNPRVKDASYYTTPSGESKGIGIENALTSHFRSHGEVLEGFILNPLQKAKDCVILLDEPESGLSITNQFKLIDSIRIAVKNNCQIFIATHCYPIIEQFDVVSLEHKENMSGIEFLKRIK